MPRGGANHVRIPECNFCECFAHAWALTTQWGVVLVDPQDAWLLMEYGWATLNPKRLSSYAASTRFGRQNNCSAILHCAILKVDEKVDHINGNGLDCRRNNMRPATQMQNARNRRAARSSTSRFLGVSWKNAQPKHRVKKDGWVAQIRIDGKTKFLGFFDREENAALAYNFAAHEHYGEFARFNHP